MKLNNIDVGKTIETAKQILAKEKNISLALKAMFKLLLVILQLMLERLSLNSKNSSKPPLNDQNRKKTPRKKSLIENKVDNLVVLVNS